MNDSIKVRSDAVREDRDKLVVLDGLPTDHSPQVVDSLRKDRVVLTTNVSPEQADGLLRNVAERFGLAVHLEQQAAYAAFRGHRQRVGKYGMTVNARATYQVIPPHSEGSSQNDIQLAAFFCRENTTEGGETVLMNVDVASAAWSRLREATTRVQRGSRPLTPGEMRRATAMYRLQSPPGVLEDDVILGERMCEIPGLILADVLAKPRKTHSVILDESFYVYWDSIASYDKDAIFAFLRVLREEGMLREPEGGLDLHRLDNAAQRRIWSSGVDHSVLFRCKITHKLRAGDLLILNNLTWAHSACNWSPESGVRSVSAAFA